MIKRGIPSKCLLLMVVLGPSVMAWCIDPHTLPQVGYHPSGLAYWKTPYFCNALYNGKWLEYEPGQWGTDLEIWQNPQFDENGYPQYLNEGKRLRAICFGLHTNYDGRPPTWPQRSRLAQGRIVLTWQGRADMRLNRGTFLAQDSSGLETGLLDDGRRVYLFDNGRHLETLEIYAIDVNDPVTDVKVWLSDPADPNRVSLEGQLYHPLLLNRLTDADWGFIRFMNLLQTNANPQRDWSDRRLPSHCFMNGTLNPRVPADGFNGWRGCGMAFEYMAALCNRTDKDMWLCVPHLATDDFVRKLAQLILYGSDGREPYTTAVANPVYPPLASHLRVYVEYSNEIWSWGDSFAQGQWAYDQATAQGLSKSQFNARRFCRIWSLFQEVITDSQRLVRVAAVFTASQNYTKSFLREIVAYGPTLKPSVEPDILAVTTYFGNGIQDYVLEQAQQQAATDDPWFLKSQTSEQGMVYTSLPAQHDYWISGSFARHQIQTFAEWRKRLLSGDAREGAGRDAVGVGGGFDTWLVDLVHTTFDMSKPLVAYEGGPSIYTNNVDGSGSQDDGITVFMEAMNRHPGIRDVYSIHLNMAKAKGLHTHVAFTDCSSWGKYGQWGHLEVLDQDPNESVKWRFLLDWISQMQGIRHVDQPLHESPYFVTPHHLPIAVVGEPYAAEITVAGGDEPLAIQLLGAYLDPGLSTQIDPNVLHRVHITGDAQRADNNYVYLRVTDKDGDPDWRTFTIKAVGGPNVLLECDFSGDDPGRHLPWTKNYVTVQGLDYSGWQVGPGVMTHEGDNMLVWSVSAPGDENMATLALALAEHEYINIVLEPEDGHVLDLCGAQLSFTIRRLDYHAPRRYAVFTSVEHFSESQAVYISPRTGATVDLEYLVTLPDTPGYQRISGLCEIRIYGFGGQWGGHRTALLEFRLVGRIIDL